MPTAVAAALSADVRRLTEVPVAGDPPRLELTEWAARFGLVAGITARGAEGQGGFDVGLWGDGPVGAAMTRWRRLRRGFPTFGAVVMAHQVHGAKVLVHGAPAAGWVIHEGADGHITPHAGVLLGVTVADCVPVYLTDRSARVIALLHAGWRGTAAGILPHAIEMLRTQYGVQAADVVMHCGAAISGAEYEVGPEVFAGCGLSAPAGGHGCLDVRGVLVHQAQTAGVGEVTVSSWCTARDAGYFHSHRRSGGRDGRQLAYLGRAP